MDPISLIVAALVEGILAGVSSVAQQATVDCYVALKGAITRKYGHVGIGQLEQDPQSPVRRQRVEDELRRAGAEGDAQLISMAEDLLQLIERGPGQAVAARSDFEIAQRRGCSHAIDQLVTKHVTRLIDVRSKYSVPDEALLSTSIVHSKAVPDGVVDEIQQLHGKMRTIIRQVAENVESMNYQSAEQIISDMHLAYADRQRAQQLIDADKQVHISYQALKTTIETSLNEMIIGRLERSMSPHAETNLILGNAILVYEITDFLIRFIDGFSVNGVAEINRLFDDTKTRIADIRRQQDELARRAESPLIDADVRQRTLGHR